MITLLNIEIHLEKIKRIYSQHSDNKYNNYKYLKRIPSNSNYIQVISDILHICIFNEFYPILFFHVCERIYALVVGVFRSFIMKLNFTSGAVFGWGQFAPSGTLMHLKPWSLYSFVAPGLFKSQCNATARQPQLFAWASALAMSLLAIPLRRNVSRTATLDMYATPVLW